MQEKISFFLVPMIQNTQLEGLCYVAKIDSQQIQRPKLNLRRQACRERWKGICHSTKMTKNANVKKTKCFPRVQEQSCRTMGCTEDPDGRTALAMRRSRSDGQQRNLINCSEIGKKRDAVKPLNVVAEHRALMQTSHVRPGGLHHR